MSSRRLLQAACGRLFVFALLLALLVGAAPAARSAPTELDQALYIPLINLPNPELVGKVTHNGTAVNGLPLKLWFYDGANWSQIAATTTNSAGRYAFASPPTLAPGQEYVVEYFNTSNSSRLYYWDTQSLTSYETGTYVHMGDFDVANVALGSPASGSGVTVPGMFSWTRRGASPSDSYIFKLFPDAGNTPYFETSPLGYVSSYQLASRPGGFGTYTWYLWALGITRFDGAFGGSYWAYYVFFTSSAANAAEVVPVPQAELAAQVARPFGRGPLALTAAEPADR